MRCGRDGLSLAFGALFLATLVAQALVGHADFNATARHDSDPITLWRYCARRSSASTCSRTGSPSICSSRCSSWDGLADPARIAGVQGTGRPAESDEEQCVGGTPSGLAQVGSCRRLADAVLELAAAGDELDLDRVVGRAGDHRPCRVQRRPLRSSTGRVELAGLRQEPGFLESDVAELAVGVPRRRLDGGPDNLSASARGVQTGR